MSHMFVFSIIFLWLIARQNVYSNYPITLSNDIYYLHYITWRMVTDNWATYMHGAVNQPFIVYKKRGVIRDGECTSQLLNYHIPLIPTPLLHKAPCNVKSPVFGGFSWINLHFLNWLPLKNPFWKIEPWGSIGVNTVSQLNDD